MDEMDKAGAEPAAKVQLATKGSPGFIVTRRGEILDAQVDPAGRIVGWNPRDHAHFTRDLERAQRLAAAKAVRS